jgi:hypothetical protein
MNTACKAKASNRANTANTHRFYQVISEGIVFSRWVRRPPVALLAVDEADAAESFFRLNPHNESSPSRLVSVTPAQTMVVSCVEGAN